MELGSESRFCASRSFLAVAVVGQLRFFARLFRLAVAAAVVVVAAAAVFAGVGVFG